MKTRIVAVMLLAGAATAPIQAEAGPLTDALRNRAGQAIFLGKVAKANLSNAVRRFVRNDVLPCFRNVC